MIDSNGICCIVVSPFVTVLLCSCVSSSQHWLAWSYHDSLTGNCCSHCYSSQNSSFFLIVPVIIAPRNACQVEIPNFEQIYTDYSL